MTEIKNQLDAMGYDYAVAIATKAEIENGAGVGSRLALKTKELAKYAGRQFVNLWADFYFTKKK